jgi:hypothetical protein
MAPVIWRRFNRLPRGAAKIGRPAQIRPRDGVLCERNDIGLIVVGHTDFTGGALPKVDLQWHVADFITGFVPDHDAQMIPCGCASCQICCNQLGVVHRRSIVSEIFCGILRIGNPGAVF